jgi:hypothetical protein
MTTIKARKIKPGMRIRLHPNDRPVHEVISVRPHPSLDDMVEVESCSQSRPHHTIPIDNDQKVQVFSKEEAVEIIAKLDVTPSRGSLMMKHEILMAEKRKKDDS